MHFHRNPGSPRAPQISVGRIQQPYSARCSQERAAQSGRMGDRESLSGLDGCPFEIQMLSSRDERMPHQIVEWHTHPMSRLRIGGQLAARLWFLQATAPLSPPV